MAFCKSRLSRSHCYFQLIRGRILITVSDVTLQSMLGKYCGLCCTCSHLSALGNLNSGGSVCFSNVDGASVRLSVDFHCGFLAVISAELVSGPSGYHLCRAS